MVVTRRQNTGPLPAVSSRTNSANGLARSKGKGVDKISSLQEPSVDPPRTLPNGVPSKPSNLGSEVLDDASVDNREVPSAPPKQPPPKPSSPVSKSKTKSKKSNKAKKHHSNKGISIFDMLSRLFLLWLTIYSLSVCPDDVQLRSPVCRALTEYRRLVLEPFIYPPFRAALEHPSIAPHIQRAQPYYNQLVQTTKPLVRRGKYEWRTRVVPRVLWLQLRARPYVRRLERQYDATLGPYVQQVSDVAAQYKVKVEPYVLSAVVQTQRTWQQARPYARPLWRGASHVPGILVRLVGRPLGDARRQWVDPQVAKIWAAVVEKGQADTIHVKATSTTTVSDGGSSSTVLSPSNSLFSPTTINTESLAPTETSVLPIEDIPVASSEAVSLSSPAPQDYATTSTPSIAMGSSSSPSLSSVPIASTESASHIPESAPEGSLLVDPYIPQSTDEVVASAYSVAQENSSQPSESPVTADATSSQISSEPTSTKQEPSPAAEEEVDEDLEKFLAEIGIDDPPESDIQLEQPEQPQLPEELVYHEQTDEERMEYLRLQDIEAAPLRAEIEGRHTQWEIDIEKFGKAQRKVVRAMLNKMREAAVDEARSPGAFIRSHVDALLQEAEKSLKSFKAYTRKLGKENKSEEDKTRSLENVVSKVEKKFDEHMDASVEEIREWWNTHIDKEVAEVVAIGGQVENLAARAQADLGMDYTWLPGVTYLDWARYHKLLSTSKTFTDLYKSMQNGTHKTAPANPLLDVMEALQEEIDDIALGFEANLTRVKNEALDKISGIETAATGTPASEPEVSILPIDPIETEIKDKEIPPVILSRGAEEIKSAVSRAEEAKAREAHEEL